MKYMTRSRKKCFWTLSKPWDKFKESSFRRKTKLHITEIEREIQFNPDKDFEESLEYRKMGDWGTKIGLEYESIKEGSDVWTEEEQIKHREEGRRK